MSFSLPPTSIFRQKTGTEASSADDQFVVALLLRSTCIAWIITKLICWRLWTTDRLFPLAPPFGFLSAPGFVHQFLFVAGLILMGLVIIWPRHKKLLTAVFLVEIASCLLDQNRWQPWEYQFVFLLFISLVNFTRSRLLMAGYLFVLVSTYFFSGLGKFNTSFIAMIWEKQVLSGLLHLPPAGIHQPAVQYAGYSMAILELFFAIALCFKRTRVAGGWLIIAMHLFILLLVGPFGLKYNMSVWPWNFLMIVQVYLLFIRNRGYAFNPAALWPGWNKLLLLCWAVLPALNHSIGWWDNFLSSRLFAGNQPVMALCVSDSSELRQLAPYIISKDDHHLCDGKAWVNLQTWAMKEMKSPPYTEKRVYQEIARRWIELHPGTHTQPVFYRFVPGGGTERLPGD